MLDQQAYTCLTDPDQRGGFSGCKAPIQYYDYIQHIDRWSNELRLASKEGGRFHWLGGAVLGKDPEHLTNYYHMPGLQTSGEAWQATAASYGQTGLPPHAGRLVQLRRRANDYLQTTEFANITFDITPRLHLEAGTVHFHSNFSTDRLTADSGIPRRRLPAMAARRTSGTAKSASASTSTDNVAALCRLGAGISATAA
jgi:hypothetical protein